MHFKWVDKMVFVLLFLGMVNLYAPFVGDSTGTLAVLDRGYPRPSLPYASGSPRYQLLPDDYSGSSSSSVSFLATPSWKSSSWSTTAVDDVDSSVDDTTTVRSADLDATGRQKGRNSLDALESAYGISEPNDFLNRAEVVSLIDNFENETVPTQVRFVLLWQYFLGDFIKTDGWKLGDKFKLKVFARTKKLTEKLKELNWQVVDEVIDKPSSAGLVTYGQGKASSSPAVWGIYSDQLYQAFITDRMALDAFFNIWRAYIGLSSMTADYLDNAIAVLRDEVLPGRPYCIAAAQLVDDFIRDLESIITSKSADVDSAVVYSATSDSGSPENELIALPAEDLQQMLDELSDIKETFAEVVTVADTTPFNALERDTAIKDMDGWLVSLEKGLQDFSKTREFYRSAFFQLVSKLQEFLLRSGTDVVARSRAGGFVKRALALIPQCLKNKDIVGGATGINGAFFAAAQLVGFIECLAVSNPGMKVILTDCMAQCVVIKAQYSLWSSIALHKPQVLATDYAYVQPQVLDVYGKKPTDYPDQVAVMVSCFPYVSSGQKGDAPLYSADKDRKITRPGKGIRVYNENQRDEASRFSFDVSKSYDECPTYKPFTTFDVKKFQCVSKSSSDGAETAPKAEAPFDYMGIDEKTVDTFADDLKKNIDVWMKNVDFDPALGNPSWITFISFGTAVSWLKTLATLDDIRMLSRDAAFKVDVADYWGNMLVRLQTIVKDSSGVSVGGFDDPLAKNFDNAISRGCAQYVVQVLNMIAETKIMDVLELERKILATNLYKETSLRAKAPTEYGPIARQANIELLIQRIENALASTDPNTNESGILTICALFDSKNAILADDLMKVDVPGTPVLMIDVMCALGLQDRIFNVIEKIPTSGFNKVPVQVLVAWSKLLDVVFSFQQKSLAFFTLLKQKTLLWQTGVNDLTTRQNKLKAYLSTNSPTKPSTTQPLPVKPPAASKISNPERSRRYAAIFRDRDLKKSVVDAETLLSVQTKNVFVFGFDARFVKSPTNTTVKSDYSFYQLGAYLGTESSKKKAQAKDDRNLEPYLVLQSLMTLLDSDPFKRGELGYALSEHLLVPVYYIAARFLGDLTDSNKLLGKMFSCVVSCLQGRVLDKYSILDHAVIAMGQCAVKGSDLAAVKKEFEKAYATDLAKLPATVAAAAAVKPKETTLAVALNDSMQLLTS